MFRVGCGCPSCHVGILNASGMLLRFVLLLSQLKGNMFILSFRFLDAKVLPFSYLCNNLYAPFVSHKLVMHLIFKTCKKRNIRALRLAVTLFIVLLFLINTVLFLSYQYGPVAFWLLFL